jgi:ABC-type glycerol-3-phosphate transport system permease component
VAPRAAAAALRPIPRAARAHGIRPGTLARHAVLGLFVLITVAPLLWVLLLSVKSIPDAYSGALWPKSFDLTHYGYVLEKNSTLPRNILNSVMVTLSTVALATACAVLGGYALVHLRMWGRALVVTLLVASLFFPTRVTSLIAIWQIQRSLGLINTTMGLVLPYTALNMALSVFIMRGIFESVTGEIGDAARIDGAGPLRTLLTVLLPLVANGIVVVVIVNFAAIWGEYLLAVTLTNDQQVRTFVVVLAGDFGGLGAYQIPRIAATYAKALVPGLVIYAIAQRWYVRGLLEGALKS